MKRLIATNPDHSAALIARVVLGLVIFPHGAQKLLGWFAGFGFEGTMGYMTGQMRLPWVIGCLVVLIESLGALALICGLLTRLAAFLTLCLFVGIILHTQLKNGFFMNWDMLPDKPEGYEFHLLVVGLCIVLIISGGGKWSMDLLLNELFYKRKSRTTETGL
jgi:putative oxidoreductase